MILAAHFPDYGILRRPPIVGLFDAVARLLSGYGNPDPVHKLPDMRPPREVWGPPKDKPSEAKKADHAPKAPKAEPGAKARAGQGVKAGIGALKSAASLLFGKRKLLSSEEDEDGEEADTPSHVYNYWFFQACGSGVAFGKKLEL